MDTTLPRSLFDQAMETAGLDPTALHTDYSGRAMYGATCPALYLDSPAEAYAFMATLGVASQAGVDQVYDDGVAEAEAVVAVAKATRQDSMGLGIVIYWPGLHLDDWEGVEDHLAAIGSDAAHLVDVHGWMPPAQGSSPSDVAAQHRIAHEQAS
jgi:hypothetical protein